MLLTSLFSTNYKPVSAKAATGFLFGGEARNRPVIFRLQGGRSSH